MIALLIACAAPAATPAIDLVREAREALERGQKDEALALADKAVAADSKRAEVFATRAQIRDARREFELAAADYDRAIALDPKDAALYQRRGEDRFRLARFTESVADFDHVIELHPAQAPYHWQRGIALYYAGQFDLAAKQFELHKTVNPDDVENAAWHYLCTARLRGVEAARKSLIPIRGDARVPMMQVHALFAGTMTADDVLRTARAGNPSPARLKTQLFYAHLYLGLFEEAAGHAAAAREHVLLAAEKYADDDYMGDVARVHAAVLKRRQSAP